MLPVSMNKTFTSTDTANPTGQQTDTMQNKASFMIRGQYSLGLIMLGAARRAAITAMVVAVLWVLFFWATFTPGGL